jgi:diadenosine tetraphosphate (Ap4A) HIT family hydrolase
MDGVIWQEIRNENDLAWESRQRQLQNRLDQLSLPDGLRYLTAFHLENGFIEDGLLEVRHFPCADPNGAGRFMVQFNPGRATRAAVSRTGRCVFDIHDFRRQQRGLQFFFALTLNGRRYNALTNPYPFAPSHTSIASAEHEPQGWCEGDPALQRAKIHRIVEDLCALAERLPDWVVVYNGAGAGATIDHLHFHVFEHAPGHNQLPMQVAAGRARMGPESGLRLRFGGGDRTYPITVYRFGGCKRTVIDGVSALLQEWTTLDPYVATANLIAVTEGCESALYAVPRNRFLEYATGFAYRIGSLEIAGVFIYSKEGELQDLQRGRIDFGRLWNVLQAIYPPAVERLG